MLKQPVTSGDYGKPLPELQAEIQLKGGNPFPGLRPFSIDECHLFFGREGQADEILLKLAQNRFVTVMGYSGSGKSSLMYCGLLPVLFGGFMTQTGPNWNAILSRPGTSPIDTLAESVVDHLINTDKILEDDRQIHKAIIASVLRSGPTGLVEIARFLQSQSGENIFFLIDQFEEIFRFRDQENADDESQLYVNLILNAVAQKDFPVYIALTMRSDFIGNCSVFPHLTDQINRSNYLVPQLTREQKKIIIEGPIAVGGGRISQRLVKRLLTDVGNDQDQLPILQHALMRSWDHWVANREPGESLDIRHYNAVGRLDAALSQHANEAYDELSSKQKEIAEILFKNITEKSQDNKGMRRPARLGLVTELAETEEEEVVYVVNHFRKAGRSFLMPAANVSLNAESLIELSHESLMRIWKRLDGWVEDEFESAQMYKRLSEAAAMYQIGKTGLWRPPDLQLALNWQKKQRPTREWAQRYDETFERAIVFLDTSRITYEAELKNQEMMQRRVLRRTRATALFLGVAFIVAVAFFIFSYIQKIAADSQRTLAETRRQEAEDQTKLARQSKEEADQQRRIAETSAVERQTALDSLQATFTKLQFALNEASVAKGDAERNLREANIQRDTAQKQRQKTQFQYTRAEENLEKANQLYMLAIAQNLATKSSQEVDDPVLAGLLAMQGYHFHKRNNGKQYDPYIYDGLYKALTKLNNLTYNAIRTAATPHVHIKSIAVSAKNNTFYTAGADGRILKSDYKQLSSSLTGYQTPYPSKVIALSKDEKFIANGSDSSMVQIYDLTNGSTKPYLTVNKLGGATNHLEFLPDGSGFIIASADKTISFVDHKTGSVKKLLSLPYEIKHFNISQDGKRLAGAAWTGQIVIIDLGNNSSSVLINDETERMRSVKFSPDGNMLAIGGDDKVSQRGVLKTYDFKTQAIVSFTGHRSAVNDVEFSPDGKLMASAGADKRLLLWILESPEQLPILMDNNNGFIWDISFTPESNYLIATCSESEIRIWPTDPSLLADQICPKVTRNMTQDEWKKYVGDAAIKYESTCVGVLIKDY
jgi:DNA-binding beta-propeller fold protein YncE